MLFLDRGPHREKLDRLQVRDKPFRLQDLQNSARSRA